ncbi:MAG: FG-GAP-like repeat-containing protein [bacterium]
MCRLSLWALLTVIIIGSLVEAFGLAVESVSPLQHSQVPSSTEVITATLDADLNPATIDSSTVLVRGELSGYLPGTIALENDNRTIRFEAKKPLYPGDHLQVILTEAIATPDNETLGGGYSWEFDIAADSGNGFFGDPAYFTLPCQKFTMQAADIDEDGDVDLVLGCGNGDLTILANDGNGIFSTSYQSDAATGWIHSSVADFNGDGHLDIAALGPGDYLLLFGGDGSGTSFTLDSIFVGFGTRRPEIADIDNDGDVDIVARDRDVSTTTLVSFVNNSSTSGWQFTINTTDAGASAMPLGLADFDNDGDVDLAVPLTTLRFAIFRNDGGGQFDLDTTYWFGGYVDATETGDLNNDGYVDLLFSRSPSNVAEVFLNTGTGTFAYDQSLSLQAMYTSDIRAADLDMDERRDIILPGGTYQTLITALQQAGTEFEVNSSYDVGFNSGEVEVADFIGDAVLDLCVSGIIDYANPSASLLLGLSNPAIAHLAPSWGIQGHPIELRATFVGVNLIESTLNEFEAGLINDGDTIMASAVTIVDTNAVEIDFELPVAAAFGPWNFWLTRLGIFSVTKEEAFRIVNKDMASISIPCQEVNVESMPGEIAVPILIDCDSAVAGFTIALVCGDERLRWSSMSFDGSLFNGAFSIGYQIDSVANTILLGWVDFSGINQVDAPEGLLATLYLEAVEGLPVGTEVDLDTTTVGPAGRVTLSLLFGGVATSWYPSYLDCGTADISFIYPDCGDADGSGFVNITDAVHLIAYVFFDGPAPAPLEAGDADCDSETSITDAVYLIQYIFTGGPAPCADCP